MSILITHGNIQNLKNRKDVIMWKTPNIKEIAVGLEINCYVCAEL
jgi:coenzyme PQQ precursor peptide PqqA